MAFEMPSDATIAAYCHSHYPAKVLKPIIKQAAEACPAPVHDIGHHMNNILPFITLGNLGIAVGGFLVGHYGIPATWTAIQSIYAKIRGEFSATPVSTPVVTPVVTPAPATPVV